MRQFSVGWSSYRGGRDSTNLNLFGGFLRGTQEVGGILNGYFYTGIFMLGSRTQSWVRNLFYETLFPRNCS